MPKQGDVLLELQGLTRSFPGVLANDQISFRVGYGEIHALLGENGAGKSTLVKMIYGVLQPDSGAMKLHGEAFSPASPAVARAHGIGMVFQHFSLFEALSVTENIELGICPELAAGNLRQRIIDVSEFYGLILDPDVLVGDLSVGLRQRIEIVRCLLQNPRLIIMDEPTSVLTPQEVDQLFKTLRRLADEGCSILYISHKLDEIRQLCHAATILRGGKVINTCTPANETAKSLAEMMIGEVLVPAKRDARELGAVRLKIQDLSLPSVSQFGVGLKQISLEIKAGEIIGVAGVAGNGQQQLMTALIGERSAMVPEAIQLDGQSVGQLGPGDRRRLGMGFCPEERLGHAAVPDMSLRDNVFLSARESQNLSRSGVLDHKNAESFAVDIVETFKVKTAGTGHSAKSLSGGNLQKFIMGREILQNPKVLIASQPTWGVDAGAASAIRTAILELAARGAAVLVISQDLDELMEISDRIAVLADGRLTPAQRVEQVTIEQLGTAMGGSSSTDLLDQPVKADQSMPKGGSVHVQD